MTAALLTLCLCLLRSDDPTTEPTTGTITGIVVDASGNPVADAIVVAGQGARKMRLPLETSTDRDGRFTLTDVPEGDYNLQIRTRDTKGKGIKSVSVTAGHTRNVGKIVLKYK